MELERALSGLPTGDSLTGQWLERAEQALAMYMAVHGPRREAGAFESGAQTEEGLAATGELDLGLLLFTFDHLRDWIDCWR